jgi:hypothetical protein
MTAGETQSIEEELAVKGNLRTFLSTKSAYQGRARKYQRYS